MEACEVVRLFVNKIVVLAEPKRRGNIGYGRAKGLRILVYSRCLLTEFFCKVNLEKKNLTKNLIVLNRKNTAH